MYPPLSLIVYALLGLTLPASQAAGAQVPVDSKSLQLTSESLGTETPIYDYVIVGGGTAGLALAARLSENPRVTVAVIEAGIHHINEPLIDVPEMFGQAVGNPAFDWRFATIPQPGASNKPISYARGKMMGGSSGLNYMAWDRASKKEYDAWEKLGAKGWNWKSLLPYFKKTETVAPPTHSQLFPNSKEVTPANFDKLHGRSGPIQASYNVIYSNITAPFVEAVNGLGIPTNSDPYTGDATGVFNCENNIDRVKDRGTRSYSASTYYNISMHRPNLKAFVSTQATKVNFARHPAGGLRATSVAVKAVNTTGVSGTIQARKEVVLSAGCIQTPQLLELSGIGNRTRLQAVGISSLIDLPGVGENFQDHTLFTQDFEILDTFFTYDKLRNDPAYQMEQLAEYRANRTGIFASVSGAFVFPPAKSILPKTVFTSLRKKAEEAANAPGISTLNRKEFKLQADWFASDDVASFEYIMSPGGGQTARAPTPGSVYLSIITGTMHPFGRGSVHINSPDPLEQPMINPGYLDSDFDKQIAIESAKYARKIAQSQPLASDVVSLHEPTSNVTTDEEWLQYVQTSLSPGLHGLGTAAMLPRELGGVVDPATLKVYGTHNLRVVDASVIPLQISTHPQSTIYAIAERAADIIKGIL